MPMAATATERLRATCRPSGGILPRIGLDTNCIQYYISDPPVQPWADCLDPIFSAGVARQAKLYVSTVVVSELLAHVHFASRSRAGYDPELDLLAILNRHFQVLDVCGDVARAAGRLRGNYVLVEKMALKTPDALIGATSLHHNHTLFVTNDSRLADALPPSSCIYLRDVALEWLDRQFPGPCLADPEPVKLRTRGKGLPGKPNMATLELGSIQPDPAAKWDRILADCLNVAAAVNESCLFFVLAAKNGRKTETREVLFWHDGLTATREPKRVVRRLHEHLGYSPSTGKASNARHSVHAFYAASLSRARARQTQPCFAGRSHHAREAEAWKEYLWGLWCFHQALSLPQTDWLFCEDGMARRLGAVATMDFLAKAANVLGWEDQR